jgi:DNA-binding transcriptional MerR regulator/effector-binding domain-containing protein
MLNIGEFARLGTVSVRALRHYDEIGLLRPAKVDPDTGYRGYWAEQLGQLNRIVALKELGLSLAQVKQLLDGITLDELRGMLMLRRAQLEQELHAYKNQLLGVEARLRYIEREGTMPADDIVVKKLPAIGVVVIAGQAQAFGPENIVPVINRAEEQFNQLRIRQLVKEAGPYFVFYEGDPGNDLTACLALPVTEPPADLPPPARYLLLPEVEEAAVTVRNGPAASIFPFVYHDLARWADEHGYHVAGPGREVLVHRVTDPADVSQQVFEIQLPFSRPEATAS